MTELPSVSRVTIYAAKDLEDSLIRRFVALGAKGYTAIDCRGMGDQGSDSDPFLVATQVRIEVITQPAIAKKILDHVASLQGRSVIACADVVQVKNAERY